MAVISPTVTAYDPHEFREQIERIAPFTTRVHIDLMDGNLAPTTSVSIEHVWWPHHMQADIHLMYQQPMEHLEELIQLNPRMVIIHKEAEMDHARFTNELHRQGIKAGLALLADTPLAETGSILNHYDHLLVFSGKIGYHGGKADLVLLEKVTAARQQYPGLEIGWDGGINDENTPQLVQAGVDVLCVGGFIQKSEDPNGQYVKLSNLI